MASKSEQIIKLIEWFFTMASKRMDESMRAWSEFFKNVEPKDLHWAMKKVLSSADPDKLSFISPMQISKLILSDYRGQGKAYFNQFVSKVGNAGKIDSEAPESDLIVQCFKDLYPDRVTDEKYIVRVCKDFVEWNHSAWQDKAEKFGRLYAEQASGASRSIFEQKPVIEGNPYKGLLGVFAGGLRITDQRNESLPVREGDGYGSGDING